MNYSAIISVVLTIFVMTLQGCATPTPDSDAGYWRSLSNLPDRQKRRPWLQPGVYTGEFQRAEERRFRYEIYEPAFRCGIRHGGKGLSVAEDTTWTSVICRHSFKIDRRSASKVQIWMGLHPNSLKSEVISTCHNEWITFSICQNNLENLTRE